MQTSHKHSLMKQIPFFHVLFLAFELIYLYLSDVRKIRSYTQEGFIYTDCTDTAVRTSDVITPDYCLYSLLETSLMSLKTQ